MSVDSIWPESGRARDGKPAPVWLCGPPLIPCGPPARLVLAGDCEGDGAEVDACLGRGRRGQRHDAVDADGPDGLGAVSGDVVRSAAQAGATRVGGSDRRGCVWLVGDRDIARDDPVAWHEHWGEVGEADVL